MNPLDLLIESNDINESLARQIEERVEETSTSLESVLISFKVPKDRIRAVFSEYYRVSPFVLADNFTISEDILSYIPEESAIHYNIVPLFIEEEILIVGANDPENLQIREVLNFISTKFNIGYRFVFMLREEIIKAHELYSNLKGEVTDALGVLESELNLEIATGSDTDSEENKEAIEHIEEDAPVTKIVATILRYAVDGSASDIHIEPTEKRVKVRFRVDGELMTSLELPINVHLAVVARVKILSSMRLDERRKPQDGRFSATFEGRKIDFRVSVFPTSNGEKVVMRILDNVKGVRSLEDVGITPHLLKIIRKSLKEPYGIILISGPTGSGKSTTLYAMLSEVDVISKNVLSLEDPVEYNMEGVSQSQIRPEIGYTFANGLRAVLRQDPDIIMVGEIRDKETAQLAIQAALTGHLVLSTIHTNNAIGVVPRLIDMGVDPYLIAPTLKLAIAQRLAKRIYKSGKEEPLSLSTLTMMKNTFETLPKKYYSRIPPNKTMVRPEPSVTCATGLRGRVAVMEVLEVTQEIQELILNNKPDDDIFQAARKNGFMTIKEDAIIKALEHTIPYEEMNSFGSNLGIEELDTTVDNPEPKNKIPVIIENDESITS